MNTPPTSRENVALGVLAGHESAEQAALRLGVSLDEVLGWCALVQQGAALGSARHRGSWRAVAFAGFAALLISSTWARVALSAGCAKPAGWPASGMTALCPDTPALASEINTDFAYLASSIKTKFSLNRDINLVPGEWVKGNNIKAKEIASKHLNPNIFSSFNFASGVVTGSHFADGVIQTSKLKLTKIYKRNTACRTTPAYSPVSTCISAKTTDPCPPGLAVYYVCGSSSAKTGCLASPPNACTSTFLGNFVAP